MWSTSRQLENRVVDQTIFPLAGTMPKARSGVWLCARRDALTSVVKSRSASQVLFVWCFVRVAEQCDREGSEDVAQDQRVVSTLEGLPMILKDGKPLLGRFLG